MWILFVAAALISYRLDSLEGLELHNMKADVVTYRGNRAVRLVESSAGGEAIAIISGSDFSDGEIEAEIAGVPGAGANETARGFVGIAFRVQADATRFECFYLRPTNGRADDQLRRNHSTQYVSEPEYPWHRLRRENPGVYESYVDLVPGEWTKVRIVVSGTKARLYVNGAKEPTLIVNDLKLGESRGKIALWIGDGTEAWFSRLTVK
jgi:3-keto-disaccharide hydrolase